MRVSNWYQNLKLYTSASTRLEVRVCCVYAFTRENNCSNALCFAKVPVFHKRNVKKVKNKTSRRWMNSWKHRQQRAQCPLTKKICEEKGAFSFRRICARHLCFNQFQHHSAGQLPMSPHRTRESMAIIPTARDQPPGQFNEWMIYLEVDALMLKPPWENCSFDPQEFLLIAFGSWMYIIVGVYRSRQFSAIKLKTKFYLLLLKFLKLQPAVVNLMHFLVMKKCIEFKWVETKMLLCTQWRKKR